MIVRKVIKGQKVTYQVGCVLPKIGGADFDTLVEFTEIAKAVEYCSWLNGGPRPKWVSEQ